MHGSGRSQGLVVHLLAGAALGAVVVLVVWIFSGGRPFGEVVGSSDVSSPTKGAVAKPAARATPADAAPRLASRPPDLSGRTAPAELRFRKQQAERTVAARTPKRAARRKKARRGAVVRVVAPPAAQTPVVAAPTPSPAPTVAAPQPAAPPKSGAGGGGTAKPRPSGPTLWAGEG
jgi:hypothetical protein